MLFNIAGGCCVKLRLTTDSTENQLNARYKGVFALQPDKYQGKALYKRNRKIRLYWTTKSNGYWVVITQSNISLFRLPMLIYIYI